MLQRLFTALFFLFALPLSAESAPVTHKINFSNVKASELIRFISKITETSFVYNDRDLTFEVSFISGRSSTKEEVLETVFSLLENHGCRVKGSKGCYVIEKLDPKKQNLYDHPAPKDAAPSQEARPASRQPSFNPFASEDENFSVYKLQFHQGDEILAAIKQLASTSQRSDPNFVAAVQSMQWIKTTNSLVLSGANNTINKLIGLIKSLDTPQKQVFIEVLVVETDINASHEFGLNWSASSKYRDRVGFGTGAFDGKQGPTFGKTMQTIGDVIRPAGLSQVPIGRGFDLGVIGDIITHKGSTFLSLGALVSALQGDHESTIVLNQKMIAQDNKCSKVFVGHNIPFAGSVVETVGSSQQTTSNIEYRNIGTSLNITPYIGEDGMITLEIDEEITEASDRTMINTKQVNGIETSKTNMVTRVHVPDSHFVVLTGMVRNKKKHVTSGIPCLGALPWVGSLFSSEEKREEKRNILIFVRPHIIETFNEYRELTEREQAALKQYQMAREMTEEIILGDDAQDAHVSDLDLDDEHFESDLEESEFALD